MEKYKFVLSILTLAILSISLASAAATIGVVIQNITASSVISGPSVLVNVTVINPNQNFTCIAYLTSPSTANSTTATGIVIANGIQNDTGSYWNATFASTLIEDANDYTFTATCSNGTETATNTTTGIVVDNTIPQAPTLSPASNTLVSSSGAQTFTGTVINANTTSCTYIISRGGADSSSSDYYSGATTYSSSTCTFTKTFSGTIDNGDWYWYITASDGRNTTSVSSNIIQVQIAPVGGGLVAGEEAPTITEISRTFTLIIIAIIVAIIVLAIIISRYRR